MAEQQWRLLDYLGVSILSLKVVEFVIAMALHFTYVPCSIVWFGVVLSNSHAYFLALKMGDPNFNQSGSYINILLKTGLLLYYSIAIIATVVITTAGHIPCPETKMEHRDMLMTKDYTTRPTRVEHEMDGKCYNAIAWSIGGVTGAVYMLQLVGLAASHISDQLYQLLQSRKCFKSGTETDEVDSPSESENTDRTDGMQHGIFVVENESILRNQNNGVLPQANEPQSISDSNSHDAKDPETLPPPSYSVVMNNHEPGNDGGSFPNIDIPPPSYRKVIKNLDFYKKCTKGILTWDKI